MEKPYAEISQLIEGQLTEFNSSIDKISKEYRYHPSIEFADLKSEIKDAFRSVEKVLARFKKKHPNMHDAESTLHSLTTLFKGKVGRPFTSQERATHLAEANRRYAAKVPPGHTDANKDDGGAGDYFIWLQMIEKAEELKKPVIFVTEDVKDDWWLKISGKTIGPLPELRREFFERANQHFYAYRVLEFLKHSNAKTITKVSDTTIEEAAQVAKAREAFLRRRLTERIADIERMRYELEFLTKIRDRQRTGESNQEETAADSEVALPYPGIAPREVDREIAELNFQLNTARQELAALRHSGAPDISHRPRALPALRNRPLIRRS